MKNKHIGFLIAVGILFILISFVLVYSEIKGAKSFCNSIDGEYSFKGLGFEHLCNQETIFNYRDGWDFLRPDPNNLDIIFP